MIRLNLIEAAERASVADETVTPVHVTDVAAQVKTSKKKTLVGLLAALFVFVAFSCFLSVFGVPKPLQGVLPGPYLSLIGAEDPSRTALTLASGQTTSAGGSLQAQAAAADAAIKKRESLTVRQVVSEINPKVLFNNKRLRLRVPVPELLLCPRSFGQADFAAQLFGKGQVREL